MPRDKRRADERQRVAKQAAVFRAHGEQADGCRADHRNDCARGTASRLIGSCSSTPESAATKSGWVQTSAVETKVEAKLSEVIQQV